jgi:hypothetical protein
MNAVRDSWSSSKATLYVDLNRNRLKMLNVHTPSYAAQMINVQTAWNGTGKVLVPPPMCGDFPPLVLKATIPIGSYLPNPLPAAGIWIYGYEAHEALGAGACHGATFWLLFAWTRRVVPLAFGMG